jgi:hypothetical protein
MSIFELIKILNEEKYPYELLPGPNWFDSIIVRVDTFRNIEEYEFTADGIYRYTKYLESIEITTDKSEDKNVILEQFQSLINRPVKAWQTAAKDLGIEFITPYLFHGKDGQEFVATGLLPEFGFGKGTLITDRKTDESVRIIAELSNEYNLSGLNPRYYDIYDRELYIETLSDWGWISKEDPPKWLLSKEK